MAPFSSRKFVPEKIPSGCLSSDPRARNISGSLKERLYQNLTRGSGPILFSHSATLLSTFINVKFPPFVLSKKVKRAVAISYRKGRLRRL